MRWALLVAAGLVYGLATVSIFRWLVKPGPLRAATNRMVAHVLELQLFIDEPRLLFRAQRDLVRANLALLRQVAIPAVVAGVVLALAWQPLAGKLGVGDLSAGVTTVAQVVSTDPRLDLVAPFGVMVESPGLRVPGENVTMWRIRALSPVSGSFRTLPVALPVTVRYPAAEYLGMPWWLGFGLVSVIASVAAMATGHVRGG